MATAKADRRFTDSAFEENPFFFLLAQNHLLAERLAVEVISAAKLPRSTKLKASFAAKFVLDALSPTNTLVGNPAAVREARNTRGKSVARGLRTMAQDLRHNGGWPQQVDATPFEVGTNMATTKGKVVFRSELIEILQYEPRTAEVYEVPLLFCPPWINKYYIMDLAPGKSLIEWAIDHGHTTFTISYRNPDASMRETSFEDYLMGGPLTALDVVRSITGAATVNTVSVCLGGTLTAIALAYQARENKTNVNSATFLNSHTDFSVPGKLGMLVDEATIATLERKMAKRGYLDARDMSRTFDALRANDLIFAYVVNNWLLGKDPPSFDLLAWNADSTRMPAKMHATYLRSCYLENQFARGEFVVAGEVVDPGAVSVDSYVLSAIDDHIVPWESAYKTARLLGGDSRFVLSSGGHIAGMVNPPSPKARHWTNEALVDDPHTWLREATVKTETWWEDWSQWIASRAGGLIKAPTSLGGRSFPPAEDAPGRYVLARA